MTDPRQLIVTAAVAVLAIAGYQALHDTSRAPAAPSAHTPGGVLQPYMRFTGSGDVTMHPDRGTISFSTHGTGATLADAQAAASRAMNLLIAKLRSDGVARSDMRTDDVSGDAQPLNGDFSADQSLTVTVRNLSRTGRLLADGAATGAQSDYGVDFSIGAFALTGGVVGESADGRTHRRGCLIAGAAVVAMSWTDVYLGL